MIDSKYLFNFSNQVNNSIIPSDLIQTTQKDILNFCHKLNAYNQSYLFYSLLIPVGMGFMLISDVDLSHTILHNRLQELIKISSKVYGKFIIYLYLGIIWYSYFFGK